ncbi:S24 family peptidase [Cronobacter sakazakii]|uniref:S24 family peptidase n=3 Tax=Cronobacter sakazakii TaxID=28141 RepID=UPI002351C646|nr:S24 family peptidase [Cronobacter sakazakii]MDT3550918.1 S24 family peptidase [Cronobacter sakazakii]
MPGVSLLLVDFSLHAKHNDIMVASIGGEFTIKRLVTYPVAQLRAENPAYPPIAVYDADDLDIVGVVICVIHTLHRNVRAGCYELVLHELRDGIPSGSGRSAHCGSLE